MKTITQMQFMSCVKQKHFKSSPCKLQSESTNSCNLYRDSESVQI